MQSRTIKILAALAAGLVWTCVSPAASTFVESGRETEWRFLDNGQRAAADWMQPAFDDTSWPTGRGPLGFGEPDVTTTVRFGPNPNAKAITTYFRHEFAVAAPANAASLRAFLRVDDGAVVYLNGRDVGRVNMPRGRITADTLAPLAIGGDAEQDYHELTLPVTALVAGKNVLAIEVHQGDAASSDLFLDVRLKAYAAGESPLPEDNPRTAAERKDPITAAMAALRRGDFARGADLLMRVPANHPQFLAAMLRAGRWLAETAANRPDLALPLVRRAYEQAPDAQEVAYAWARTQLLARVNLRVPFKPREHPAQVPEEWQWIVDGPHFTDRSKRFPRAQLEADLDYLETMIANGYSYAERCGVNWRGALDAVRASLADETPVNTFTLRLHRALTIFGDGHSYVHFTSEFRPRGYLPFLAVEHTESRVLALRPNRSAFLDDNYPYLVGLDGRPLDEWLRVAGWEAEQASPHFRWHRTVHELARLNYLRSSLGLPAQADVRVQLASEDGQKTKELTLRVADRAPPSIWPKMPSPFVRDGIGYLQIEAMLGDEKFLNGLDAAMRGFRETRGLILDLRGNRGGTVDALRRLLPYFLRPGDPLRIVNVAAYLVPTNFDPVPREGFLPEYRHLRPIEASIWTAADRREIEKFLAGFQPDWRFPNDGFSNWHVMGIRHETNPNAYFYDRPVVVLSDARAFSAGDSFLGAFKGVPKVTILGTASGGGSGRMADYILPNSKATLTLCQMASFRPNGALFEGAGVEPDVVVQQRPTDYLTLGDDSVLEAAMNRLKEQSRPKSRRPPGRTTRSPTQSSKKRGSLRAFLRLGNAA